MKKKLICGLIVLCLMCHLIVPLSAGAASKTVDAYNYLKNITTSRGEIINEVYYFQPASNPEYHFVYDPSLPNDFSIMYLKDELCSILTLNANGTAPYTLYVAVNNGMGQHVKGFAEIDPGKVTQSLTRVIFQSHDFPSSDLTSYQELGALCLQTLVDFTEFILENTIYCIREFGFVNFISNDAHLTVSGIGLEKENLLLSVGDTYTLKLAIVPAVATQNNAVSWTSSNRNVATVTSSGRITAVSKGTAIITATAGGKQARCQVTVMSQADIVARTKTYQALKETIIENGIYENGAYTFLPYSNDMSFGLHYDENNPSAILFHYVGENQSATIGITEDLESSYRLLVNYGNATGYASIVPENVASDTDAVSFYWTNCADAYLGEMEESGMWMLKEILVNLDWHLYGTEHCIVDFGFSNAIEKDAHALVTGLSFNKNELSLAVGDTATLGITILPKSMENTDFVWTIENTEIVDMDENGVVTAYGVGTTKITVFCGKKSAECIVKVICKEHTPNGNTDCNKNTLCTVCNQVIKEAGEHTWDEGTVLTQPNCETPGKKEFACTVCKATKTEPAQATGHQCVYAAQGAMMTEVCANCDHHASVTISASDAVYTGKEVTTATVAYSEGWQGGESVISYENNMNVGEARASITYGSATATTTFNIAKAKTHTITLGNLSQTENNTSAVTATVCPTDNGAVVKVEYQIKTLARECNHIHSAECGEGEEIACVHVHDETCGYAEAGTSWVSELPTEVGTYAVRATLTESANIEIPADAVYTTGTLTIAKKSSGGGGSGGGGGGGSSSGTTTKPEETEPEQKPEQPTVTKKVFTDVQENAWYRDAVEYAVENGLMNGVSESAFAPDTTVTRGMVMTVLARLAGADTEGGATWYEKGMAWAVAEGISDGTKPEASITREQLATMLFRFVKNATGTASLNAYEDSSAVSPFALEAMQWAVENGIVSGMSATTLNPSGNATRAQFATILMRFCETAK